MSLPKSLRARQDVTTINYLLEEWAGAVREGDMARILAHHDVGIVMFNVVLSEQRTPEAWTGIDAYRAAYQLYLANNPGAPYDLSDLVITHSADCAFAHAILRCGAGKGDAATINVRLTVGLERRDADWVVMHEHHSVGVGM